MRHRTFWIGVGSGLFGSALAHGLHMGNWDSLCLTAGLVLIVAPVVSAIERLTTHDTPDPDDEDSNA